MPIYRVNTLQNMFNQQLMNVYYYETTAVLDSDQLTEVADDIRAAYVSSTLAANTGNSWGFDGIGVRRVDIANQPEITVIPTSGALSGGAASEELPAQVALLVKGTALTAFPRRVRTYLAGLTEGSCSSGFWTTSIQNIARTFIEAIDEISVTGDTLGRLAVELGGTAGAPVVVASNRVEQYSTSSVPGTQRRRRLGVGS